MVRKSYLGFLGVLAVLAISFLCQLTETEKDFQPVDAVVYARVIVGAFLLITVVLIVQELLKLKKTGLLSKDKETPEQRKGRMLSWGLVFATFCIFLFYCGLFTVLGYYTTGFIVLLVYMGILFYAQNGYIKPKNLVVLLIIALATTGALYLVFSVLFELWLPRGILI